MIGIDATLRCTSLGAGYVQIADMEVWKILTYQYNNDGTVYLKLCNDLSDFTDDCFVQYFSENDLVANIHGKILSYYAIKPN